jgi:hypothetical protein
VGKFPACQPGCGGLPILPRDGHSLCGALLTYWEWNGGLARFGFPITEPAVDAVCGYDFFGLGAQGIVGLLRTYHGS